MNCGALGAVGKAWLRATANKIAVIVGLKYDKYADTALTPTRELSPMLICVQPSRYGRSMIASPQKLNAKVRSLASCVFFNGTNKLSPLPWQRQ